MAFAVHGISELAFTGAAAGLLLHNDPIDGALAGGIIVAVILTVLGSRERERDSSIGIILAFGLGVGVLLLSFYHGFAAEATNILFGDIFGVSLSQVRLLLVIAAGVIVTLAFVYRPLQFASVDPDVAEAKGVPVKRLGGLFLIMLALTVTEAAQIVGTLLVLSLTITPAAAAIRLTKRPAAVSLLSVVFALIAGCGGLLVSLALNTVKPSVCITFISFGIYLVCLLRGDRS